MGQYKHLSLEEREEIMVSRSHGKSFGVLMLTKKWSEGVVPEIRTKR